MVALLRCNCDSNIPEIWKIGSFKTLKSAVWNSLQDKNCRVLNSNTGVYITSFEQFKEYCNQESKFVPQSPNTLPNRVVFMSVNPTGVVTIWRFQLVHVAVNV